jgi:hypothetical protein
MHEVTAIQLREDASAHVTRQLQRHAPLLLLLLLQSVPSSCVCYTSSSSPSFSCHTIPVREICSCCGCSDLYLSLARSLLVVAAVIKPERASGATERAYLVFRRAGGRTWMLASQSTGKRKRANKRARAHKHTTDDRCLSGNVFFVRNRVDRPSAMMLLLCIAPLDPGARSTACAKSVL